MLIPGKKTGSAELAKQRLLQDQALRPIAGQRARLVALSQRLEQAGRQAVVQLLATHVQRKPQLAPLLRRLLQDSPDS